MGCAGEGRVDEREAAVDCLCLPRGGPKPPQGRAGQALQLQLLARQGKAA